LSLNADIIEALCNPVSFMFGLPFSSFTWDQLHVSRWQQNFELC
jgi:hypothetical protein